MKKWLTWMLLGLLASSVPLVLAGCEQDDDDDPEVDVTGFWRGYSTEGTYTEIRLDLTQQPDGTVSGTANAMNITGYPMSGNPCSGRVTKNDMNLTVDLKDSDAEDTIKAIVVGREMRGDWTSVNGGFMKFVIALQ